ncbi:MAG TPA: DUF6492 family protein [Methylocystis sp.]|nr:DUF6492 family protein [Methylocystis sp.]
MRCDLAILGLDLSPQREVIFDALLHSLEVYLDPSDDIVVTLVGADEGRAKGRSPLIRRSASVPSVLGKGDEAAGLPTWYREQLLALYFAANCEAEFALVLPVGAFAIGPLSASTLLPRNRARTQWESVDYHPDWWRNARSLTGRTPLSGWEGPTILPAILSAELARWTLDLISREAGGADPKAALRAAIDASKNWSAMTLYAAAAGSRLTQFHHDSFASRATPLHSSAMLWSQGAVHAFHPAEGNGDRGLFTYVQASEISEPDDVLDRLYACLRPPAVAQPEKARLASTGPG